MKQPGTRAGADAPHIDPGTVEDRYYLFAVLNAFSNRMQAVGDGLFEEVTWKQWFALLGVSVFQAPPSVSQVASFVGTSHQNAKQLLLRLQAAGLVQLQKDDGDLRRTLVHLCPAAQQFETKYQALSQRFMQGLFEGIPEEDLAAARRVLDRMNDNLYSLTEAEAGSEES